MQKKNRSEKRRHQSFFDFELDLHGYFAEDALAAIDRAINSNPSASILVIHGKGDGVLRKAVRDYLKKLKYIESFRTGEEMNLPGGDGVTLIYT